MKEENQPKKRDLKPFNPENCDIRTQLMFEDWATIPAFKIITLLLARKGKSIFSAQGIAEMLQIPKSTAIHALKLLRENEYIVKEGSHYYLNVGFKFEQADQPIGQSTNPLVKADQPIGQESTNPLVTNNDKEIIKKNIETSLPFGLVLKSPFDSPEVIYWVGQLIKKLELNRRTLDQVQLDAFCMTRGTPERLINDIKFTCTRSKVLNLLSAPEVESTKSRIDIPSRPLPTNTKPSLGERAESAPISLTKALAEKLEMKRRRA